jgi:hypothetical protein
MSASASRLWRAGYDAWKLATPPDDEEERLDDECNGEPRCTDPKGHSWVTSDEDGRSYCEWCLADGDA